MFLSVFVHLVLCSSSFFFIATATTELYTYCHTLSLHDALPIYDRNTEPLQRVAGLGVTSATIEEIAQQADLIFMSLPSGEIVRNVVEGNGGNEIGRAHA